MRRTIPVLFVIVACAAGCRDGGPKEKYFGGQPVDHWLEAARGGDAKQRKKAADVLGNVGTVDARAIPALIVLVKDRDAKVRDAAVLALSKNGPAAAEAAEALREATRDKDATVRAHAALALERVRGAK